MAESHTNSALQTSWPVQTNMQPESFCIIDHVWLLDLTDSVGEFHVCKWQHEERNQNLTNQTNFWNFLACMACWTLFEKNFTLQKMMGCKLHDKTVVSARVVGIQGSKGYCLIQNWMSCWSYPSPFSSSYPSLSYPSSHFFCLSCPFSSLRKAVGKTATGVVMGWVTV